MRAWRKLESSIITSERLSRVSDSAKWLFALLLVAQDDEGKYPYTKPRIHALIAGTEWDSQSFDRLLSELSQSGMTWTQDGFIYLLNGAEKNGTPSNSKSYVLIYPEPSFTPESGTLRELSEYSDVSASIEKSRVRVDIDKETSTDVDVKKVQQQQKTKRRKSPSLKSLENSEALLSLFDESETLVIRQKFPHADLDWEAQKCVDWHNERGGSGNWKLSFKNWLERVRNGHGESRGRIEEADRRDSGAGTDAGTTSPFAKYK